MSSPHASPPDPAADLTAERTALAGRIQAFCQSHRLPLRGTVSWRGRFMYAILEYRAGDEWAWLGELRLVSMGGGLFELAIKREASARFTPAGSHPLERALEEAVLQLAQNLGLPTSQPTAGETLTTNDSVTTAQRPVIETWFRREFQAQTGLPADRLLVVVHVDAVELAVRPKEKRISLDLFGQAHLAPARPLPLARLHPHDLSDLPGSWHVQAFLKTAGIYDTTHRISPREPLPLSAALRFLLELYPPA